MNVVTAHVETRTFNVTADGVAAMDTWLEHLADRWQLSEKTAFGARLCLAELAANVLEHGTARSSGVDHIIVSIDRLRDGIEVEFRDSRESFDPTNPPRLPEVRDNGGGRGLALLQAFARDLTYVAEPDCNRTMFRIAST
jgi:anti-sigma regulatory factor (Ser/Thr protein kinase)